jgi:hypothetical protein
MQVRLGFEVDFGAAVFACFRRKLDRLSWGVVVESSCFLETRRDWLMLLSDLACCGVGCVAVLDGV